MSKSHERWIERDVSAIVTREEAQLFRNLPSDGDRDMFQKIFWTRRDPDLSTPENEFRRDYEERIEVANERLRGRMGPGFLTDMGQVFLLLGFPLDMASGREPTPMAGVPQAPRPSDGSATEGTPAAGTVATPRFQTWRYADGLEVRFRSQRGYGYRLIESEEVDEVLESARQALVANPLIAYELDASGHLLPPALPAAPGRATELLENLVETKSTSDELSFRVAPGFFRSQENVTYVPVLFELDGSALDSKGGLVDVSFFGALEDLNGALVQRFEERAELVADEHVRYEIPLEAAPGTYTVYLGVLDEISGTSGSRVTSVQVPSYQGDGMTLSSVLLFDRAAKTSEPGGIPGRAFQFAGVKLEPIGGRRFHQSDALGVFFYVYGAGGTDVTVRYVFYRDGQETGQTRPRPILAAEGIALASDEIPLASFAPGSYRLLIQVEDKATGEVIEKRVSFELEP